jgi:hypothetical protein
VLPPWLKAGARVWFYRSEYVVDEVSERGVVLAQLRRRLTPSRRLLTPQETAHALETGELRPFN